MVHALVRIPVWPLLLLAAGTLAAQSRDIEGDVHKTGFRQIPIAVPDAEAGEGAGQVADELAATLRDDLDFSGFFDILDSSLYDLIPTSSNEVRHEDWISIGADALLLTKVRVDRDRVDLDAWLYDNTTGTLLFGKRYGGRLELLRRVAHKLADDLVLHYTGRSGIALTRVAFVSSHGRAKEIYLMDYDGRRVRRLTTTDTINLSPVWSPKGDELAFASWRGRQPGVYVMTSEGELGVLNTVGGELSSAPDWSPDGGRLVYSSDVAGNTEIYLLERRSGDNKRLTYNPAIDTSPAVSPNGREIAFTSDRTGSPQIYLMDTDGVNVRRVSWTGSYNDSAVWSPRGDRLAYASRIDGRFQIVVLDLTTDEVTRITRARANHENPSWAPNGRHLVFAGDASGRYQIHTIRADGTDERQLTRGPASFTPDWSE